MLIDRLTIFERESAIINRRLREIENQAQPKYRLKKDFIFEGKILASRGTIGIFETCAIHKMPLERRYRFGNTTFLEHNVIMDSNQFEQCS